MRRIFLIPLIIVLAVGFVLGGCGEEAPAPAPPTPAPAPTPGPAPAPTPAPAPAPTPKPAPAPAEPIKLLFGTWAPPGDTWVVLANEWGADLEKRTNGRVKVEYSVGGALGKTQEFYDLVLKGVCDVANISVGTTPGRFPVTELASLPWTFPSSTVATKAWVETLKKGYADKEYADSKIVSVSINPADPLFTANKPVTTLEDVKGLKLRVASDAYKQRVEAWGAVSVYIPLPEAYSAFQKGTIDGTVTVWVVLDTFKLADVLKYSTGPAHGCVASIVAMNKQYYEKLPPDIQKIVDDMYEQYSFRTGEIQDLNVDKAKKVFLAAGGQMLEWAPADWVKIKEMYGPLWDKYIADTEAKGLQPRQAIEDFNVNMEKYGAKDAAVGYIPKS